MSNMWAESWQRKASRSLAPLVAADRWPAVVRETGGARVNIANRYKVRAGVRHAGLRFARCSLAAVMAANTRPLAEFALRYLQVVRVR